MNIPYPMQSKEHLKKDTAYLPYSLTVDVAIRKIRAEISSEQYKEKSEKAFEDYYTQQYVELLKEGVIAPVSDACVFIIGMTRIVNCLFRWEQYKQVYSFNKELFNIIADADNDTVPVDIILKKMPYNCFFIQNEFANNFSGSNIGENFVGVYVIEQMNRDNVHSLAFHFLGDDLHSTATVYLSLENNKNATIKDLLYHNCNLSLEEKVEYTDEVSRNYNTLKQVVNCVLYLCSDKVDITKTKQEIKSANVKEQNKKPKKVNVGFVGNEVAKVIRENKARYKYVDDTNNDTDVSVSAHKGKEKSPHFRKAHFHAFWVGAHDSPDRHLEVKLLSPILVKGGGNKDVTTIRKISLPKALKQTENDVFEINEQDEDEELDLTEQNQSRGL